MLSPSPACVTRAGFVPSQWLCLCFSPSQVHTGAGCVQRVSIIHNIELSNSPEPLPCIPVPQRRCASGGKGTLKASNIQKYFRFFFYFLVQVQIPFLPSTAEAAPSSFPLPRVRGLRKEQLGSAFGKQSLESTLVLQRLDAVSLAGCFPSWDVFGGSRVKHAQLKLPRRSIPKFAIAPRLKVSQYLFFPEHFHPPSA